MGGLGSQGRAVLIPVTRLVQGGSLLSKRKGAACFSPLSPEPPRGAGASAAGHAVAGTAWGGSTDWWGQNCRPDPSSTTS